MSLIKEDDGIVRQDNEGHSDQQSVPLWVKNGEEVHFTISEFRGNLYMGIRLWLQDASDESWFPTRAGFSIPFTLDTSARLFKALVGILSKAEVLEEVIKHTEDVESIEVLSNLVNKPQS